MDIAEEHVSRDNAENDVDIPILLELSEKDTLFEKKKKLLKELNLSPKGPILIKSSCIPHHLNSIFNLLLYQARVISLNEIEFYFVANPVDFHSPRNELKALHSILKVIDKLVPTYKSGRSHVLQSLRDVTVSSIHEFGSKIKDCTKILGEYSCDKEKDLLKWGESRGVNTKLDIAYVEGAGRGAIAKKDLNIGDSVLEIPLSLIISEELVHESDMFPILDKVEGLSSETMLLLWSMKERHNLESRFKLYFDTLPEAFNTGLSFGINAIMALDGTLLLEEIMQAKEHLRTQYDELIPELCKNYPNIFPQEIYTWEHYLWACELWYSNSMKIMFPNGQLRTCLIPIAGFLNHSTCPHILHYGKVDATTNTLKFCLSRPCNEGEQIFLSYGNYSSAHFITFYGFLPPQDNPYDVIPLDFEEDQVENHMVRGTWLSKNNGIFNYGLPAPLLDYVYSTRGLSMQRNINMTRENLEMELEIVSDICSMFESMMETLGELSLDERESTSWDVKLALEGKDVQKRIINSIIASCNDGCELIRYELQKCIT